MSGKNYRNKPRGPGKTEHYSHYRAPGSKDLKALDSYLERNNLQRHSTAKDGSCLFRAVAEQVFLTQVYHQKVRSQCVSYIRDHRTDFENFVILPFEEYLDELRRELWGGELELVALGKLYERTILVYMCSGERNGGPKQFGPENGVNPIRLAYYDGNHYDSVYSKQHMQNRAMCQGVLYTMLYEGVLGDNIPQHWLRRLQTLNKEDLSFNRRHDQSDKTLSTLRRCYHHEVLRGMATRLFHDAALQAHRQERLSIERSDRQVANSMQLQVGDICRFKLPDGGRVQEGEISALNSSENCHTVYVFSHTENWEIPVKELTFKSPYNATGRRGKAHNVQSGRPKNPPAQQQDSRLEGHTNSQSPANFHSTPNAKSTLDHKQQSNSKAPQSLGSGVKSTPQREGSGVRNTPQREGSNNPQLNTPTNKHSTNPKSPAPLKPPTVNSTTARNGETQHVNSQPVKVDGGPGGSLTSEDYSENSSSSDESASNNKPPGNLPGNQQVWHGEAKGLANHTPQAKVPAAKTITNGYPEPQGRESPPYLVPQLPRDASSQPEDDWPGFDGSQEGAPHPGSSKILAALSNPRVPEPGMVAVTSAPPFGVGPPMFPIYLQHPPTTAGGPNVPVSYTRPTNISPVYHSNHPIFPMTMSTPAQPSQSYIVQRTPSNSQFSKPSPVEQFAPSSPSGPRPGFPVDPRPEIKDFKPDTKLPLVQQAKPVYGKAKMITASVQAAPEMASKFTQYNDTLSVTMYTQTPHREFVSTGVSAVAGTKDAYSQTKFRSKTSYSQTPVPVVMATELEPGELDDVPSPAHMISYGIQYARKCLEAYTKCSPSERASEILDTLRNFEENSLPGILERRGNLPPALDSSQQNFLQSFGGPELPAHFNGRPVAHEGGPSDSPPDGSPGPGYEGGELQLPMQPGFPMPMPMQPMMRPMMMMPMFPVGSFPMPPPFAMMPHQMMQPNISEHQTHILSGTPHSNFEEEPGDTMCEEANNQPGTETPLENTNAFNSNLVPPSVFTVPASALAHSSSEPQPPPDDAPTDLPSLSTQPPLHRLNSWEDEIKATGGEVGEPEPSHDVSQNLPNRKSKPKPYQNRSYQQKPKHKRQEFAQNDDTSGPKRLIHAGQMRSDESQQFNGNRRSSKKPNRSFKERQNSGSQGRYRQESGRNGNGRRQEPTQASDGNSHRDDQTRSALSHHSNTAIPCSAFQPKSFSSSFPAPPPTMAPLVEDCYPQPLPAQRWKFTELSPPSDEMIGHNLLKDQWPSWGNHGNGSHGYSESVEDPFPLVPTSQGCWDSDLGDLGISSADHSGEILAECVPETSYSSKTECVAYSTVYITLPK